MPRSVIARAVAVIATCGLVFVPCLGGAQTLSPFSEFQGLSEAELETVQVKITDVSARLVDVYTLVLTATGHAADLSVFRPFYRQAFLEDYSSDYHTPRTCATSTSELAGLIDSLADTPSITDGD